MAQNETASCIVSEQPATVPGYIGFAFGRTTWWQPVADVENERISEREAAMEIAHNFEEWIRLFHDAQSAINVAA